MPYGSLTVANRLLEIAAQHGMGLDPLKLLKLVYLCHGWSHAQLDRPLIGDRIEAWQYGPVPPDLYKAVRACRYNPVPGSLRTARAESLTPEDDLLIRAVYDVYGKYSGGQLSNLTHAPGSPWATSWDRKQKNTRIPDELIAGHYRELAPPDKTQIPEPSRSELEVGPHAFIEAAAIGAGISLDSKKQLNQFSKSQAGDQADGHTTIITTCFTYLISALGAVAVTVSLWHYVTPQNLHFLTDEQLLHLEELLISGGAGVFLDRAGRQAK